MATRPEPGQEADPERDPLDFSGAIQERRERSQEASPLDFTDALRSRRGRRGEDPEPEAPADTTTALEPAAEEEESLFQRMLSAFELEEEPQELREQRGPGGEIEPPEAAYRRRRRGERTEPTLEPLQSGALSPGAQEDLLVAGPEIEPETEELRTPRDLDMEQALHEELARQGIASEAPERLERTPGGSLYDPDTGEIVSLTPQAGRPDLQRTETTPEPGVRDVVTREEAMAPSEELRRTRRRMGDTSRDVSLAFGRGWSEAGMATGIGLTQLAGFEGAEESLRSTREELRDYYGTAQTTAGRAAQIGARFSGELAQFIAPELALTRLGALPKTVSMLRRIGREVAIGAPIDAMIAASDRENSMAGFVADLYREAAERGATVQGPDGQPISFEQYAENMDEIASTPWKRALYDSFLGSVLAAGAVPTLELAGRAMNRVGRGSRAEGEALLREARVRSVADNYRQAATEPRSGLETVPLEGVDLQDMDPEVLRGLQADLARRLERARQRGIVDAATERDLNRLDRALAGGEGAAERGARTRGGAARTRTDVDAGPGPGAGEIGPERGREGLESGLDVSGPAPRGLEEQQAELEQAMEARIRGLEEEASTDPLTELPNRRGEQQALERRPPDEEEVRVQFMADVDNFKVVNDRLGQEAGDRYLQELSRVLEDVAREEDAVTLARIGGDEFRVTVDARAGTDPEALRQRFNQRVNEELEARGMDRVEDMPLGVTFFEPGNKAAAKMEAGRSRPRFEVERRPPPAELEPPDARAAAINAARQGDVEAIRSAEARLTEAGDRGRRAPVDAEVGPRGEMPSSDVFALQRGDIDLDPERFQYKTEGRQAAGRALEGVEEWDYTKGGVMAVWWDPELEQWFVVNGHNRMGLANRVLDEDEPVNVMELHAPSPRAARAMGAMQNIAEGRGTAIDAAKFFRDAGFDAEAVAEANLPLTEAKVQKGLALSNLHPSIFRDVVQKRIKVNRGVIIGESGLPPEQQLAIHQSEDIGELNQGELEELIRVARGAGSRETTQETLFGEETFRESNLLERVKISRRVKRDLKRDKRIFGPLSKESRASRIEQKGAGQIERERAGELATEAEQFEEVYESLSTGSGPVVDILNRHARAVGAGEESLADAAEAATEEVKDALRQFIEEGNLRAEVRRAEAEGGGARVPEADRGGEGARAAGDREGVPGRGDPDRAEAEGAGEPISSDLAARIDRGREIPEVEGLGRVPDDHTLIELPGGRGYVLLDDGGRVLTPGKTPGEHIFDSPGEALAVARTEPSPFRGDLPQPGEVGPGRLSEEPATEEELAGILREAHPEDADRIASSLKNTRTRRLLEQFDQELKDTGGKMTARLRAQLMELASRGEDVTSLLGAAERQYNVPLMRQYQRNFTDEYDQLLYRSEEIPSQAERTDLGGADDLELFENPARYPERVQEFETSRAARAFEGGDEGAGQVAEEVLQYSLPFSRGSLDGAPIAADRLAAVREAGQRRAWVDVRGQKLETTEQVHRILRPFRDPKAERLHFFLLDDDNRILSHSMESSGAINYVMAARDMVYRLRHRAERLGATRIVSAHNHPSGMVDPSNEDIRFLHQMRQEMATLEEEAIVRRELREIGESADARTIRASAQQRAVNRLNRGEAPDIEIPAGYVIDHGELARIDIGAGGRTEVSVHEGLEVDRARDWTDEAGRKLTGPSKVQGLLGSPEGRPELVDVVYMDTQNRVLAVEPHRVEALANAQEWLPSQARGYGARQAIIALHMSSLEAGQRVGPAGDAYEQALVAANRIRTDPAVNQNVRDIVVLDPETNHRLSAASFDGILRPERGDPDPGRFRLFENLPEGEEVARAAVRHPGTNQRWEGSSHFAALEKVPDDIPTGELEDGFVTTSGRFVGRKEAMDIERGAAARTGDGIRRRALEQQDDLHGPLLRGEDVRRQSGQAARQRTERAIEQFGTTEDPFEGGYILRDGRMLDFSGRRLGRGTAAGSRTMDHRRIAGLYDEGFGEGDVGAVFRFEGEGNLRLSVFDDLVQAEMATTVTADQVETLKRAARRVLEAASPEQSRGNSLVLRVRDPKTGEVFGQLDQDLTDPNQVGSAVRQVLREAEEAGYEPFNVRELSRGDAQIPEGLADGDVVAAQTYPAAPRAIATDQANHIRDVAQTLKSPGEAGFQEAVEEAAEAMVSRMRPGARLIPLPNSQGSTEANRALAEALARRLGGEVADVLDRVPNEMGSYMRRTQGEPGLTADEIRHELVKPAGDLEDAYLVDNVVATGATATSARRALGEEVPVVAWAKEADVEGRRARELRARQGGGEVRERPEAYGQRQARIERIRQNARERRVPSFVRDDVKKPVDQDLVEDFPRDMAAWRTLQEEGRNPLDRFFFHVAGEDQLRPIRPGDVMYLSQEGPVGRAGHVFLVDKSRLDLDLLEPENNSFVAYAGELPEDAWTRLGELAPESEFRVTIPSVIDGARRLDEMGPAGRQVREEGERFGQGDIFGSDAPAEGGDQFRMFGEEGRALEGLSASEERAREIVVELQGAVDRQTATPTQMERYNEAVKLLRRNYPVKTDELVARARQRAAEEGPPARPDEDQTDIFGPEAGAALPKVLRQIAGMGTGGTVGALMDEENRWRGAAIGALIGGGLVELPGAWTDVMAGRRVGLADRVEQAARAAARGEPPGAPRYRGPGRMTESDLEEAVNFEKFQADPTGQKRLEEEVRRVGSETGVKAPHKVVSMQEAEALARRLSLDPSDVLPNLGERMTGVELTALGNIVVDNIRKTVQMLEALNHPALTREQEEVLLKNLRTRENQNNHLLEKILRGRSQKGRDLGQLKLTAMGARGPDGSLRPEPFYLQAKRFLGDEAFTTEHAARINEFIANDDIEGLAEYIASLRQHSLTDKVVTWYKAALMSAPITQIRNLTGNSSMSFLEQLKDPVAYVGDRLLSLAFDTGLQTKAAPRPTRIAKASWEGVKKGAHEAEQVLRTGIRIDDAAIKYDLTRSEVSFNNVFADVFTKAVFRGMFAGDRFFKGIAFMRALDEMAQVTASNEGLKAGTEAWERRVAELIKAPTDEMAVQAIHDAEIATFTNRNALGDIGVNIKRRIPLMEAVIPFTNTPANIALRTVDYTPFGFLRTAKGVFDLAKASAEGITDAAQRRKVFEIQRRVANDFGRNVVGSLGVAALGYYLAKNGMMTGAWPSDRETAREWQRRDIPSNGIYIPEGVAGVPEELQGKWGTVENISPLGNILGFGANLYGIVSDPETTGPADIFAGAGVSIATTVSEQSFLTGLSESLAALNNPERASGDAFRRTVASFLIPNIVKKVNEGFQGQFYEAETMGEEIGRRLPPPAQRGPFEVPPAMDVFGRDVEREGGVLKSLFDPFNTRTDRALEDEVIMELSRTGASVAELQRREDETRAEFRERRREVGQRLYAGIQELTTSGPYRAIPEVVDSAIRQNADLRGRLDPETFARDLQRDLIEDLVGSIKRGQTRRIQVQDALRERLEQQEGAPSGGR